MNEFVIKKYQEEERMMILIYAQWCVNMDLDPVKLYQEAYPDQVKNDLLVETLELTLPKEQSEEISNETVLSVLQAFGNDDLAFLLQKVISSREK